MMQGSHALYYGFSTMDWRAGGLDGTVIGMLWGLGVAAEIVLFALSGRLPKSLRPTTLLAIGGLGAIVRWTAMAFDPPTALLPALQLLHAASFGAAHLGMMGFLARAVPRELAATAQGFAATWSGVVNASATFASGFVYAASGSLAYLVMAAMALVGLSARSMPGGCGRTKAMQTSLQRYLGVADDLGPSRGLVDHALLEIGGRDRRRLAAELDDAAP